jgi:GNAT superfamily N-acetyltransferase
VAGWSVALDADDAEAYAAFATDRLWCGYAIADLEPPFRAYSTVAIARRESDVAACLVLRHPAFTAVVPHGSPDGLVALLALMDLPRVTHLFARAEHLPALHERFDYAPTPMQRMAIDADSFRPVDGGAQRLGPDDLPPLLDLYSEYDGNAFQPDQLPLGVFYGVRSGTRLLAAGGTQVTSRRSSIAAVGNIFTRPEARGRGLAAAVTSAVVAELLAGCYQDAILNVAVANEAAIHVYSRLGFRTHCQHYEGVALLRSHDVDARHGGAAVQE